MFAALLARADGVAHKLDPAGVAEFPAASQAWDGQRFAAAAELFRQASTNAPGSSTNLYWLGAAQFHRMLHLQMLPASRTNKLAADAAMDSALAALATAIKLDAQHNGSRGRFGSMRSAPWTMRPWKSLRTMRSLSDSCVSAIRSTPKRFRPDVISASRSIRGSALKPASTASRHNSRVDANRCGAIRLCLGV